MTRIASSVHGIGTINDDELALLDVPYPDLGAALSNAETMETLAGTPVRRRVPLVREELLAPVPRPSKIWLTGWAYHEHRQETGRSEVDGEPPVFLAPSSAVTGPYSPVHLPAVAPNRVDYEGELAVVIGRTATNVKESDSWDYVAGLSVCNDVSARDVQKGEIPGWNANVSMAKGFDTFKPLGPAVVTADDLDDPADLLLQTWVDGELRQEARTSQLIWSIPYLISYLSRVTTLVPGDVLLTGTPGGVGHKQGKFLAAGSKVRIEIGGLGAIENVITGPHVKN